MNTKWLIGCAICALAPQTAFAQDTETAPVDLGNIEVVDQAIGSDAAPAAYESFDPVDTGTSTISSASIGLEGRGDIDTTELIKKLPHVQLGIDQRRVTSRNIQNIRPSDFTISGGNYYNNNIMIDGVQANSIMDVTNTNPANLAEIAGQTSQTLYIDPSLIGEIVVRDSNVSAEYGDFTGGVVDFRLRDPGEEFSVSVSSGFQSDDLVNFHVAAANNPADPADLADAPSFNTYRFSISADLPVNDQLRILAAYTRAESAADYQMNETYGGRFFQNSDLSENYLIKAIYDLSPTLTAEGQITVSPYQSEFENLNRIDDFLITHSDGLSAYAKLFGDRGAMEWEARLSYSLFDSSRDWENNDNFSWPSSTSFVNWCSSTSNCSRGGFGDLEQEQEDLTFDFKFATPFADGELRFGGAFTSTEASKRRLDDSHAYSRGLLYNPLACPVGDPACAENETFLRQHSVYQAYDANVTVVGQSAWTEYERDFANVTVRAGLRYSHDDFLDNHDLGPRLSTAWEFRPDWFLNAGANRYYGKNMVSFAIRSQYPDSFTYRRTATQDGSGVYQVNDWEIYRHTRSTDYAQADLDTPYSDELTISLTAPTPLDGQFRLKGVERRNRDAFARSPNETVPFDDPTATSSTTRLRTITNDGGSDYQGVSAEWVGRVENHAFAANVTWSDTTVFGGIEHYFDEIDLEELAEDLIYYNGAVISLGELYDIKARENFATPIIGSLVWSADWLQGRLATSLGAYYTGEYETIDDSGANIDIGSERFDVYEIETREEHVSVNFNANLELFETGIGSGGVNVRIDNLLDETPDTTTSSTYPYLEGRSIWIGFSYTY